MEMEKLIKGVMTNEGVAKYDFGSLAGDLIIPECPVFPIWICDASTNEYNSPMGQYKSTCSLSSDDFLSLFWDCHVKDYDNGYKVTKRILGRDESNTYDVVEYVFTPKNYSRTVMLSSGMHTPELPAEFGLAYFMKYVMEKNSPDFKWLRDNVRFKIVPLIQPWGFNQNPLKYENVNGVNINKNWDVDHVWTPDHAFGGAGSNGEAPYSEAETRNLVKWINENAFKADLWIDCHTDSQGQGNGSRFHYVTGSTNSNITKRIQNAQKRMTQAYIAAGFFDENAPGIQVSVAGASAAGFTAKHKYAQQYCGIPGLMIEQYTGNPLWGGDPKINNSEADINFYVTNIRAFVLACLEREEKVVSADNMFLYLYQWFMDNHYLLVNTKNQNQDSEIQTYSVTFNANGHAEDPSPLTNISKLPSELPCPVDHNDRYFFDSWYTDDKLIVSMSPNEILLSDVTLYAKWLDTEADIKWITGGIDTNTGSIINRTDRAQTGYIKVKENGVITIDGDMSDYVIVDIAVHRTDRSYISLTTKYNLTKNDDGSWVIKLNNFTDNYPTGKFVRFSIKRTDLANISLSELTDNVITTN